MPNNYTRFTVLLQVFFHLSKLLIIKRKHQNEIILVRFLDLGSIGLKSVINFLLFRSQFSFLKQFRDFVRKE